MRKLGLLILCALLVGGCASEPEPSDGGSMEDQRSVLQQRPSMEEVTAKYEEMQQKLRDRLSAELGLATAWVNDGDAGEAGCAEFPDVAGAEKHSLDRWLYQGNISDSQWPQAERIADEVSSEYGFTEREVVVDRPADHKVEIRDDFGAALQFGTAVNTILSLRTGCHLLQSAKGGSA
ncbi:LppA family lipoprotein [Saccharopolyspora sp. 5N708]|uniref:LppA family lipoprotein n=1 Tax=Saccharopolyspora sp. 5N708 TaxID=3457424 RepID=UPI003FD0BC6E